MNIKPTNYRQMTRLARCLEMKKYIPTMTDEKLEEVYRFMEASPRNNVRITGNTMVWLQDREEMKAEGVDRTGGLAFGRLEVSDLLFHVASPKNPTSVSSSSVSGNNNNNNG